MVHHHRRIRRRPYAAWVLAALLLPLTAAVSSAQRWEYFYGGPNEESGHNGVQPVSSGGYIAVGVSHTTPTADIYVVRTDDRGGKFWEATYDINGNIDTAFDILELANGDFAITGFTSNKVNNLDRNDMFILLLDRCGAILGCNTYATQDYREVGYDIIEARSGDFYYGTYTGDLIVAGYTTWSYPERGTRDAWLIRVNRNLDIIWSRRYEIGNGVDDMADDALFALDECVSTPPSDPNTTTYDIVAVGTTNSPNYSLAYDGLMIRVDGNTGLMPAVGNLGVGIHGGYANEEFYSVDELEEDSNSNRGNIVAVGYTRSTSMNSEVYLVRTPPQPWNRINDRTLGDNGEEPDTGRCIREIRATDVGLTAGNFIVTGCVATTLPAASKWDKEDLFLQEYQGNFTPVAPTTRVFGGKQFDIGWSVAPVGRSGNCRTAGFVACGTSRSPLCDNVDPQDMYLIKTDNVRSSNCNDTTIEKVDLEPILPWIRLKAAIDSLQDTIKPVVTRTCRNWGCLLCVRADGTVLCPIAPCPAGNCNDTIPIEPPPCPPNCPPPPCPPYCDTIPAEKAAPGAADPGGDSRQLVVIPNPVAAGGTFAIDFEMPREARVAITVSNARGEIMMSRSGTYHAGARQFPITTEHWPPGVYFIDISDGSRSITAKVVVTD